MADLKQNLLWLVKKHYANIRISYLPRLVESPSPREIELNVIYDVSDDQMMGENLDEGWYNYNKQRK